MGKVGETTVTFRMLDDRLDPEEVTARLGVTPTSTSVKGGLIPSASPRWRSRVARTGRWSLASHLPRTAELNDHLCTLLDQLDDKELVIHGYREQGYQVDFFCGLFPGSANEGLELPQETLARVAALGATLGLDIYSYDEDDQDGDG
jgi:hypothetical protein